MNVRTLLIAAVLFALSASATEPNLDKAPVRVKLGTPKVTGACVPADVIKAVARREIMWTKCYELMLKKQPTLAGTATIRWTINKQGRAEEVWAVKGGTLKDISMLHCLRGIAKRLRFEPPSKGVCEVHQPAEFSGGK